ncbi:MAG TPA: hypothetical protein VF842_04230 [Flavobacterium sp.]
MEKTAGKLPHTSRIAFHATGEKKSYFMWGYNGQKFSELVASFVQKDYLVEDANGVFRWEGDPYQNVDLQSMVQVHFFNKDYMHHE